MRLRNWDLLIGVAWAALGVAAVLLGWFPLWSLAAVFRPNVTAALLTLGALTALSLFRSHAPLVSLLIALPIVAIDTLHGGTIGAIIVFTDLVYATVKYSTDTQVRYAVRVTAGGLTGYLIFLIFFTPTPIILQISAQWVLIILTGALWGWDVRSERRRTQHVLQFEHRQRERGVQQAIAHDLHDLVANHIAVAGLHIEAAKLLTEPQQSTSSQLTCTLEKAKHGTDQAHTELRNLIMVLTQGPELSQQRSTLTIESRLPHGRSIRFIPNREALDHLIQHHSESKTIARVLNEVITNVARHGSGDTALTVSGLTITVTNTIGNSSRPGSGTGLENSRRLIEGIGGSITAEPSSPEQWMTTIVLPIGSTHE